MIKQEHGPSGSMLLLFFRIMKDKLQKNKKIFFLVLVGILTVIIFLVFYLFFSIKKDKGNSSAVSNFQSAATDLDLNSVRGITVQEYYGSFSDIFSGMAWSDTEKTTLSYDGVAMSYSYKPNIFIEDLGSCSARPEDCLTVNNSFKIKNCLNGQCLEIKNDRLFYNQQEKFPVDKEKISRLKIKVIGQRWLVAGVVSLADGDYRPTLWWFDGNNFDQIKLLLSNGQQPKTNYLGNFAIGSQNDQVLVLYSDPFGLAWQINGQEVRDISSFFNSRINNNGFNPEIISFNQDGDVNWYIFDRDQKRPMFLKFWQNGTKWIEGSRSLTEFLPEGVSALILRLNSNNQPEFLAKVLLGNQEKLFKIKDQGFVALKDSVFVSKNLTTYDLDKPDITRASISGLVGGWSGFEGQLSLSGDNKLWKKVNIGQEVLFSQTVDSLWWRLQIKANENIYSSPCLKMVSIDYYRR